MFGQLGNARNRRTAYTLAEMLVVMAIIALIFLALPPITKKMFKVDETRKAHGRYECFWKAEKKDDGSVTRRLYSYTLHEGHSGNVDPTPMPSGATSCTFIPPTNVAYFIVYAVGGGGAGASIEDGPEHAVDSSVSRRKLEDPKQVYSLYEMYKSSNNVRGKDPQKPDWLNFFESQYMDDAVPWADTVNSQDQGNRFDVARSSDQQTVRYRLSGSAGKVVTAFMPSAPSGVTMILSPGKGGDLNGTETDHDINTDTVTEESTTNADGTVTTELVYHRSGGDGKATVIEYQKSDGTRTTALTARGGKGGNGRGDNQVSMLLVGGKPGDNGTASMTAVAQKDAGFSTILEGEVQNGVNETGLPYEEDSGTKIYPAGRGGAGETQYVENTDGVVYYEYDKCFFEGSDASSRYLQRWMDLLAWTGGSSKFNKLVYANDDEIKNGYNCEYRTLGSDSYYEVERTGQCTMDFDTYYNTVRKYNCTIGYNDGINTRCATRTSGTDKYEIPSAIKGSDVESDFTSAAANLLGYNNNATYGCTQIQVEYNQSTGATTFTPNPTEANEYVAKNDGTSGKYYSKFYDCKFQSDVDRITCKEKLSNIKFHKCTTTSIPENDKICSSGYKPVDDGSNGKKCEPQAGGDGAVVIIW